MAEIILVLIILAPALLTYFLKSNASLGFLSLCAGFITAMFATSDIQGLLNDAGVWTDFSQINIFLILVPLVLTLILSRKSVWRGPLFILQVAIGLGAGAVSALLAGPALVQAGIVNYTDSGIWTELSKAQTYLVAGTAIASLAVVWFSGMKHFRK
ncbi:MAG: hypothetical protein WD877_00305 [Candidatus Saccharimonadales bacterium]